MSFLTFTKRTVAPSSPATGKETLWIDNSGLVKSVDAGGVTRYLDDNRTLRGASTANNAGSFASDTYLTGSAITIPAAGGWVAASSYLCIFDMVKTAAGTAAFTINVRMGTLGTTGDASVLQLAFAVGTAAVDTGIFEVLVNFRTVGSGTAAVVQGIASCTHHLAATGLITTGASGSGIIIGTSSGFNSTTQTILGLSVNGGASFSGTNTLVQASLQGL